ncbi:uncharacterized protein B0T23DRAFT_408225 [Neurospora hispaniola]|uniref:Uncharacterized protein n=1 Tax=Neurospora hispaniola TaxID=588809 RepID=A0AAJ0MMQ6_9PEZI|nr:hypothetical protein B0T23DRAFT_408225 [Neurospora hispaniola]
MTYNTRDSLVVTDPTTSLALTGLSMGERTGSRVFQWVWSYVIVSPMLSTYICWRSMLSLACLLFPHVCHGEPI